MNRKAFERLNAEREERSLTRFANPRNAAAGSLRLLETSLTASRRLDFYAYFLLDESGRFIFDSHWKSLEWLADQGFKVNPRRKLCVDIDEALTFCREWEAQRETLPYEITGLFLKSTASPCSSGWALRPRLRAGRSLLNTPPDRSRRK